MRSTEVVHGRHQHILDAGECKECHGVSALLPPSQYPDSCYSAMYAAVGLLPPRLEAPRWSSPPSCTPSLPTLVASESAASHGYENSTGEQAEGKDHAAKHIYGMASFKQFVNSFTLSIVARNVDLEFPTQDSDHGAWLSKLRSGQVERERAFYGIFWGISLSFSYLYMGSHF